MPFESSLIQSRLKNVRSIKIAGKTVFEGKLEGRRTLIMNTGIGKVNAAHSAACVIERYPVKKILNIGVGGAYPRSSLAVGDIAVASKEIYADEGVITGRGFKGIKEIGIPLVKKGEKTFFNEFPVSVPKQFMKSVLGRKAAGVSNIKTGSFVTVSVATGTNQRAEELGKRYHAVCENMEGAAIAQVCAMYGITMIEVRGISNIVGKRDKRKWDLSGASENCQRAVLTALKQITG